MSTNTLIVGAVLLSFGLGVPQEAPQAESEWQQELQHQSEMEFKRQQELQQKQEMEFKLQQIAEKQAIGIRVPRCFVNVGDPVTEGWALVLEDLGNPTDTPYNYVYTELFKLNDAGEGVVMFFDR